MPLSINRSDLIINIAARRRDLGEVIADVAVREILDLMTQALSDDDRIEIRGFGSFCLHHRDARMAHNPQTGQPVEVDSKAIPHFKPGKSLREQVNQGFKK